MASWAVTRSFFPFGAEGDVLKTICVLKNAIFVLNKWIPVMFTAHSDGFEFGAAQAFTVHERYALGNPLKCVS